MQVSVDVRASFAHELGAQLIHCPAFWCQLIGALYRTDHLFASSIAGEPPLLVFEILKPSRPALLGRVGGIGLDLCLLGLASFLVGSLLTFGHGFSPVVAPACDASDAP